ncbi:MAG: hypothetical protein ACK5U7_13075 [Bacteroidota bacterium]|jgi:hypothetical protein
MKTVIHITDPKACAKLEAMLHQRECIKRDLINKLPPDQIEKKYGIKIVRGLPY